MADKKSMPSGWGNKSALPQGWGNKLAEQVEEVQIEESQEESVQTEIRQEESSCDKSSENASSQVEPVQDESFQLVSAEITVQQTETELQEIQIPKELFLEETKEADYEDTSFVSESEGKKHKNSKKRKSKKKILRIIFCSIVVAAILAGAFVVVYYYGKNSGGDSEKAEKQEHSKLITDTVVEIASTEAVLVTEAAVEVSTEVVVSGQTINLEDYMGSWSIDEKADEELILFSMPIGDLLEFYLINYSMDTCFCMEADLIGNVASFESDYIKIKGTLTFYEALIVLEITESEEVSIPKGKREYKIHDKESNRYWEYVNDMSRYSGLYTETPIVRETEIPSEYDNNNYYDTDYDYDDNYEYSDDLYNEQTPEVSVEEEPLTTPKPVVTKQPPQKEYQTVVVEGVTFEYASSYKDEKENYSAKMIVEFNESYSGSGYLKYNLKIDGDYISDSLGSSVYYDVCCYDENDYLIDDTLLIVTRNDSKIKEISSVIIDKRTAKVIIDLH